MANLEELLIRIDATTEGLRRELGRTEKDVKKTTSVIEKAGKRIDNTFKQIANAAAAYLTFRTLKNIGVEAVQTSKKFDALEASMLAASGTASKAEKNLKHLKAESERLGLVVLDSGKAFARLTAAARGTSLEGDAVREVFTGISEAATVLRFNTEDTEGAIRAFEQMLSKGKVSMEELRLQLGDRLPGAFSMAAKAMGKDPLAFEKMVADGKVFAEDFLPKFIKLLREQYADGVAKASNSAQANINRFTNSLQSASDRLGSAITSSEGFNAALRTMQHVLDNAENYLMDFSNAVGLVSDEMYRFANLEISVRKDTVKQDLGELIKEAEKLSKQIQFLESGKVFAPNAAIEVQKKRLKELIETIRIYNQEFRKSFLTDEEAAESVRTSLAEKLLREGNKPVIPDETAKKLADYRKELERTYEQTLRLKVANMESEEAYEALKIEIDAHNEALSKGLKVGTKEFEQTVKRIKQIKQMEDSIEALNDAREESLKREEEQQKAYAEALNRPWQDAFQDVQDELADMLAEGRYSFESLADVGKRLAAEVAAAWIIRPALGQFITTGQGQTGITSPGGFLSEGGSQIGNLMSLGNSLFADTGGGLADAALSAFDDFAADIFGTASSSAMGPFLPGQGTASSVLGSTFSGSYGGAIANMLGLGTGNMFADTGASLAGAAIGNLIAPGIGGIIGSFALTSVLGGLFGGGSRPHPAATAGVSGFTASGALRGLDVQAKHLSPEDAQRFAQSLGTVTSAMAAVSGINFSAFTAPEGGTAFQAGVNDGQGFFTFGSHKNRADLENRRLSVMFDPQDENDMNRAMGDLAKLFVMRAEDIGEEVNETLLRVLDNIQTEGRTLEEVIGDIAFATGFDKMGQYPQELSEVAQAVEVLRDTFNEAAETAERLALSVEKVRQFEQVRMQQLLAGYSGGIAQSILGVTSPGTLARMTEQARYAEQLRDLELLGATQKEIQQAELLHQINMHNIEVQNSTEIVDLERERLNSARETARRFEAVERSMEGILHDLTLGQYSPLDPIANLDAFRARIQTLGNQARLGDVEAAEELSQLLPEFVALSGEVNGFNASFEADRQIAEAIARDTLSVAQRQVSLQSSIADAAERQISVLQNGFASLEQALAHFGSSLTVSDITNAAQGLTGLTDAQRWSTIYGRDQGLLGQNETATGGLLASRLDAAGADAWAARNAAFTAAGFATGGMVRGVQGHDAVMARLTDGEFVMRRSAVQNIGAANLAAMNNGSGGTLADIAKSVNRLAMATAAGDEALAKEIAYMRRSLDSIERNARLVASS